MAHLVVFGLARKLKWVKARLTEVIHYRRDVPSPWNNGGLKAPTQFIRLIMCDHDEGSCRFSHTREKEGTTSDYPAYEPLQDRSTLKEAVAKLKDCLDQGMSGNSFDYSYLLRRCSKEKDLESANQVHDFIKDTQMEQHPYVANVLLKCYIECGRMEIAQDILKRLLKKDTIIWNMMIAGFFQHHQTEGAIEVYKQMRNESGRPDVTTFLRVLKACASPIALNLGKEIHAHIIRAGFQADMRIGTALVRMYTKCGSMEDARAVFGRLGRRDIVSWTVMIGGLAEHGLGHEAFSLFLQMQREGCTPDAITYLSILNPCASKGAVGWVKEVHGHAMLAGLDVDMRVGNALVQMYAKSGSIEDARAVFGRLCRRDVVSWTVMIGGLAEHGLGQDAFSLFLQMQREGCTPDVITYLSILNPYASTGAVEWVKEVHGHAMVAGLDVDVRVGNALLQMYAKSGSIEDARAVFSRLGRRDIVSWTVIIGGLAKHGRGHEAFSLFLQMQREGFTPDAITYLSILNPCASTGALNWVKEVHGHATKVGLDVDVRVGNALVQMYVKSGSIANARAVFGRLLRRDVISWNVMIGGLAEYGLGHEAFSLFLEMQREGFSPDAITYLNVLNPFSSTDGIDWVKKVHAHAMRAGLDIDVRVRNAIVHMYCKNGCIEDARAAFRRLGRRDVVSWTVMIGGLAEHGLGHEAFSLFLQMQREGFTPDAITFLSILNPCASTGAGEWVKEVHGQAILAGLDVDLRVGNALVQMYGKTGLISAAKQVFDKMPIRDFVTGVVMIGAFAQCGQGREALQLFEEMKLDGVKPNCATFVVVLSACSHAGLVEEGCSYFNSMMRDHCIEPVLEHYNCIVDMLGRAGRLEEAKLFILNMPVQPDEVTWTTLLSACSTHHNVELAELAAKECLKLKPTDAPPYVLLSNVYASVGNWNQVT